MQRQLILALPFLATMGVASAQITEIGPFTGDESDSFETQQAGSFDPCVVGRVFNNMGDLCANSAHITGSWGFMCTIFPDTGTRLYGSTGSPSTYTFDAPVQRFGGMFGTNSWSSPNQGTVTIDFFDTTGALLDSRLLSNFQGDCQYYWNGYESTSANIKEVVITNSQFGGGFINMDSMEIAFDAGTGGNCTDFELNGPCVFSSANHLTNQIPGVTFAGPNAQDGGAVLDQCGNFGINARSGTNFLAFNRNATNGDGGTPTDPENIMFPSAVNHVEIYCSGGGNTDNFTMQAFDSANNMVASSNVAGPGGVWTLLEVNAPGIVRVELTQTGDCCFVYDDLCWSGGGPNTIGTNFQCSATVPNSTGMPGVIAATGSDTASDNDVLLTATQLPDNQFGYFLNSPNQNPAGFNPPGSQGNLCIGPQAIGRYNQPGSIFNTMGTGTGALQLDLPNTPTPTGNVAILSGQTWYFTCWFRDNNPGSTSNFTDAVCIAFN